MTEPIRVLIYTFGMGSGHLSRVNAVIKGFKRAKVNVQIFVHAPRSKYIEYLEADATVVARDEFPRDVDIFVCDWKADELVLGLPQSTAKLWVGLKRMGTIPANFPSHFLVVAIEPRVKGDILIWPIISTWRDELISHDDFCKITGTRNSVALLCENGAFASHPDIVFAESSGRSSHERGDMVYLKCSNSPHAAEKADLDFYPIARLFHWPSRIVIGGGYNSIHECLCFADMDTVSAIYVGGDDQKQRLKYYQDWAEMPQKDSQATKLAETLIDELGRNMANVIPHS